ncbi:MAG TPA: hypothetical protein VGF48_20875 [Thermoanaerobaculia bacterium]|jgi:hypothetical protein
MPVFLRLRALALALSFVTPLLAQTAAFDPATAPKVLKATGSRPDGSAGLGDRVTVNVRGLDQILTQVSGNCRAIVLYVNQIPLSGMQGDSCDPYTNDVRFVLDRNPEDDKNDAAWHRLLGSPNGYMRPVMISVGASDQYAVPTDVRAFPLHIVPKGQLLGFIVLLVLGAAFFLYVCARTSIIRSPMPLSVPGAKPFSLARTQMAFWSFLSMAGYVFCWMITGELDTISDSMLALIGIGAGTALGAALIDSSGNDAEQPVQPSTNFLVDILSDGNGVSIHRFQMFAWTVILGGIFCASVYAELSMPEFDATMLGLMGISSGTYLGFKFPEKKTPDTGNDVPPTATPAAPAG